MRISDWSSDVCSSDLFILEGLGLAAVHVHCGDAELESFGRRFEDPAAPVTQAANFQILGPVFICARRDQARQITIELALFAVLLIEPRLHFRTSRHVFYLAQEHDPALDQIIPPASRLVDRKSTTSELQSLLRIPYAVLC